MQHLTTISLFSGVGMLDRGVHAAIRTQGYDARTILYCESDEYARNVLSARMRDGSIEAAPIWDDVTTLHLDEFAGWIDAIVAGFPCQPFSLAGSRLGIEDERYLFGDIIRLAEEARIPLLFLENVPGLLTTRKDATAAIADVARLLDKAGFDAVWDCVQAAEAGAPHKRERFFCIAWRRSQAVDDSCQARCV